MKNKWLFIAGLSGFLCVAIGAFAAHGLSKVLEPKELAWIETGVKYQMFHTIAILAIVAVVFLVLSIIFKLVAILFKPAVVVLAVAAVYYLVKNSSNK